MLMTATAHGRLHVTMFDDEIDFLLSPPPPIAVIGFDGSAEFWLVVIFPILRT